MPVEPLYPLTFQPIYMPKVWGGRTLERFGRTLPGPPDQPIGESWELTDLDSTSDSGAGGEPAHSIVANGPLAGASLDQLIARLGPAIHGTLPLTPDGRFPLLVKLLDARRNLSVQVHPSPAYAATHPDAHIKHESWYVLDADTNGAIYLGLREGVTMDEVRRAARTDAIADLLRRVPVKAGDFFHLPSGTVHALGAGVVIVEVQTPSDTTFRLYDWGRTNRQMHVEQALRCIEDHIARGGDKDEWPGPLIAGADSTRQLLVSTPHYRIERRATSASRSFPLDRLDQPRIIMFLRGAARLTAEHPAVPLINLTPITTTLLPATIARPVLHHDSPSTWLDITFPAAGENLLA